MELPLPNKNTMCHHTAFEKRCFDMVTQRGCPKWIVLHGKDPQKDTAGTIHGCVDSLLPMLLIENSQMSRQTGAAVESFRNAVVEAENMRRAQMPVNYAARLVEAAKSLRDEQARIGGS